MKNRFPLIIAFVVFSISIFYFVLSDFNVIEIAQRDCAIIHKIDKTYNSYIKLSSCHSRNKNYLKSIEVLNTAIINENANRSDYYTRIAENYLKLDNLSLAEKYYIKSIELGNNNSSYNCPYEGLGLVYFKSGDYTNSEKYLKESIRIRPNASHTNRRALALLYIENNEYNKAIKVLEEYSLISSELGINETIKKLKAGEKPDELLLLE